MVTTKLVIELGKNFVNEDFCKPLDLFLRGGQNVTWMFPVLNHPVRSDKEDLPDWIFET